MKRKSGSKAIAEQINHNNAILHTENGVSINIANANQQNYTEEYPETYNDAGYQENYEEAYADPNGADYDNTYYNEEKAHQYATDDYNNNNVDENAGYEEQMFLVLSNNLKVYKDPDLQIEDTEAMFIEQDSSVLGSYMNDFVVYLSEPYYVYVPATDVQVIDTTNVDGYQWDTSQAAANGNNNVSNNNNDSKAAQQQQQPQHSTQISRSVDVDQELGYEDSMDNSGLTGILQHVPATKSGQLSLPHIAIAGSNNSADGSGSNGNGVVTGATNGANSAHSSGHIINGTTIFHDTGNNRTYDSYGNHVSYNSAEITLPYNEEVAAASNMMSIDAAIASQMQSQTPVASGGTPNGYNHNNPRRSVSHSRSQSHSRKHRNRRPSSARGTGPAGVAPELAQQHSHSRSRSRHRTHSDFNGYEPYNSPTSPQTPQMQAQGSQQVTGGQQRPHSARGAHNRSHSRSSHHRSHHSRDRSRSRSQHSSHQRTDRTDTRTGDGSNEQEREPSASGVSEMTRSRRGSMSSVSTFMDVGRGGGGRGGRRRNEDMDAADIEEVVSADGSSAHYVPKAQLKNPLYYNQVANEILARRAMSLKDGGRKRETIVDNIIVNKFSDARPIPGRRYFTQSRRIKNGIAVILPFSDEPAVKLETTLTQLYHTHEYLVNHSEVWKTRPFHVLLVQDGWGKAHPSLQRYLKKLFPKQYYFNEIEPEVDAIDAAAGGDGTQNPENVSDEIINGNYENLTPMNNMSGGGASPIVGSTGDPAANGAVGGANKAAANKGGKRLSEQNLNTLNNGSSLRQYSNDPLRPPLLEQQSRSFDLSMDPSGVELSKSNDIVINYDESYAPPHLNLAPQPSHSGMQGMQGKKRRSASNLGINRRGRGDTEASVSEYAPSIAMDLPSQSQYWWEFHEEFDGSYSAKQGPITFIFEKTIDNPTYFQLKFNRNEKGRHDKRIENQLTLHLTLIIKLDARGKHNSREWFLGKSGFGEAYHAQYLLTTTPFTLFDVASLDSLVNYLDTNPDCSVVTGRQRAMTRGMEGKKMKEFKCSLSHILRLTQTFDWELTNNIYNVTYATVGFLPVVPGHCGLYRASDILQDNARDWYFTEVYSDPQFTGLVLGNLQHAEDRLLTYAAILKPEERRHIGYVSDALFYVKIPTDIEAMIEYQREWINGQFAGFLYLLWTRRWNFWQWNCDQSQKLTIFAIFLVNFAQMCCMFFGTSISMGMLRSSVYYLFDNYIGDSNTEARTTVFMLFAWLLWLAHLTIHNTEGFHGLIMYLLLIVSILTSILAFFTYFMLIFHDEMSIYDALFAEFVTQGQYDFVGGLVFLCLVAPFPCSIVVGGVDSAVLLIKSIGAYLFTFHLMWGWMAPYAIVRSWDIDIDGIDHASDENAGDPLNNEAGDARERMEARFRQKSRMIMLVLIFTSVAGFLVPAVSFWAVMVFLLSLAFFCCVAVLSAAAKGVGIDLKFFDICCTLPENRRKNMMNRMDNTQVGNEQMPDQSFDTQSQQHMHRANSVHSQQSQQSVNGRQDREESENSNDGFIIIPEVYQVQTKARYERMRNKGMKKGAISGGYGHGYDANYGMNGMQYNNEMQQNGMGNGQYNEYNPNYGNNQYGNGYNDNNAMNGGHMTGSMPPSLV